ncbi:MAG: thioredoxin domain-containing protein [Thermaerobacter sp.]|nr:MAG: hypothetical protein DIU84_06360 [Bacillota bacterium]
MAARTGKQQAQRRQEAMIRRRMVIGTVVVAAIVALFVVGYITQQPPVGADGDPFVLESQPMAGDPSAPVAVVEFGDFKCPYCAQFAREVYPGLKEAYIDTGKARFYFINYAFIGPDSYTAAAAAEAVYDQDPEAFWAFYEALYQRQGPESQQWATKEFLLDLAREVAPHLDFEALEEAIDSRTYRDRVQTDLQIGRRLGVNAVPTVFVNGQEVTWSLEAISAAIDAALAEQGQQPQEPQGSEQGDG